MSEELKAALLNARAAAVFALVSGMNAENTIRERRGESLAFNHEAFEKVIVDNRCDYNGITLTAIHGEY